MTNFSQFFFCNVAKRILLTIFFVLFALLPSGLFQVFISFSGFLSNFIGNVAKRFFCLILRCCQVDYFLSFHFFACNVARRIFTVFASFLSWSVAKCIPQLPFRLRGWVREEEPKKFRRHSQDSIHSPTTEFRLSVDQKWLEKFLSMNVSVKGYCLERSENTKRTGNNQIPLSPWKTGFKQAVLRNNNKFSVFKNNLD